VQRPAALNDAPERAQNVPVTDDQNWRRSLHRSTFAERWRVIFARPSRPILTVWNAADSPKLRAVLRREGEAVVCPELRTRYPGAAVQGTLQIITR
jgi:hypothetical protein